MSLFSTRLLAFAQATRRQMPCLRLLNDIRRQDLSPDVRACNTAIGALACSGLWEEALHVLGSMGRLTRPDIVTMNSAISACAKSSKWIKAIQLLDVSKHVQQGPDMFTYGAAIRACEGNWRVAVQLLDEMQEGKLQPNEE
ncbi:unnamed protein product [Effrenium voratum]|nr:unnamed protein product [Effrenium voratum]